MNEITLQTLLLVYIVFYTYVGKYGSKFVKKLIRDARRLTVERLRRTQELISFLLIQFSYYVEFAFGI